MEAYRVSPSPLTDIRLLPDVFDGPRCRAYIEAAQQRPWRGSAADDSKPATRSVTNDNIGIDTDVLLAAVARHLPRRLYGLTLSRIVGERTVFLRYSPGDRFDMHTDSAFRPEPSQRSLFAVLIYLNADFAGGGTHFPDLGVTVSPQAGAALIIPHGLRHRGEPVTSSVKYAIHSYVLYGA